MHTDLVVALDIGGTKIAGALVDGGGEPDRTGAAPHARPGGRRAR